MHCRTRLHTCPGPYFTQSRVIHNQKKTKKLLGEWWGQCLVKGLGCTINTTCFTFASYTDPGDMINKTEKNNSMKNSNRCCWYNNAQHYKWMKTNEMSQSSNKNTVWPKWMQTLDQSLKVVKWQTPKVSI